MSYDYLVHGKYDSGELSAIFRFDNPLTERKLEDIEKDLSREKGKKVLVVSFSPIPHSADFGSDCEGGNKVFLVRNVTNGEVAEFSIRSEAEEYYTVVVSLHGDLFEYEMVARIQHHLPPETLS